jgi:hypothetical protein
MAGERQWQIARFNAVTIVHDTDEFRASSLELNLDSRRTGINGILNQLFDNAGGPFDYLARGDLGDNGMWQLTYARQGMRPGQNSAIV